MFGGIQDITKEKNDVYIYDFVQNNWKKIHTTTNSIYDCSPTLKREKKVLFIVIQGISKKSLKNSIN